MEFQQSPKWILNNENPNTASSKGLSIIGGSSSITINNTIYLYGLSKYKTALGDRNMTSNIWSIASNEIVSNTPLTCLAASGASPDLDDSGFQPYLPYSLGVATNNLNGVAIFTTTIYDHFVNNTLNTTSPSDSSRGTSSTVQLSVFQFDVITRNGWSKAASLSTDVPLYRKEHSVTLSVLNHDDVYVYGGINTTHTQNDFWSYSLSKFLWKKLVIPSNIESRCGHTASMLSDGKMIILGGHHCSTNDLVEKSRNLQLFSMSDIAIFDTVQSIWNVPLEINGVLPKSRAFHSAIVSDTRNTIFICGGQNEIQAPYHTYIGSQRSQLEDLTAILDTNTWTWRVPKPSIYQPFPQSYASISLINDTKVVFGFGSNYQTIYDNFHVFDMSKEIWEPPATARGLGGKAIVSSIFNKNGGVTSVVLWIIIGCILSTLVLSYVIAIWTLGLKRFHSKFSQLYKVLRKEIWQPRVGEPGWAESSRLFLKTLFLVLFIYLIFTLTNQVLNSPIIDQLSYESNVEMLVDVPDVKFCFENWEEAKDPIIRCTTDFGAQCSNFLYQLPNQTNADGTRTLCSLFRAPSTFNLGQISKRLLHSSGSFLKFDYYSGKDNADKNETAIFDKKQQLKIELYNRLHDPNLEIYKSILEHAITNTTTLTFQWNNIEEENMYRSEYDLAVQASKNAYRLGTQLMSTISFELIKRISLEHSMWNYFGIAPTVITRYEIDTMTASESFSTEYNPLGSSAQPFGSLHVFPYNYQTKVLREQKAFAFVNAIGIFGGLFGLLFSLQTCLFGYRPRSPWGYMHRWSFGQFRSSLMSGLHTNFFPSTMKAFSNHVPLVQQPSILPTIQHQMSNYSISSSDRTSQNIVEHVDYFHQKNNVLPTPTPTPRHGLCPLIIPTETRDNTNRLLSPSPVIDFSEMKGDRGSKLRMAFIEERIHTLERLFQAYYIDDEIFRSLDRALQADRTRAASSNTVSLSSSTGSSSQDSSNVAVEKRRIPRKDDK